MTQEQGLATYLNWLEETPIDQIPPGEAIEMPGIDDPRIQYLIAVPSIRRGGRSDTILKILNAAGKSGWTNHQILELGSELALRWGVRSPEKNLYEHWRYLFGMLRNVRSHYPSPGGRFDC